MARSLTSLLAALAPVFMVPVFMALAFMAAPLAAQAQVTIPQVIKPHDAAKVAVAVQILDNLKTGQIAAIAGRRNLLSDPLVQALPAADQTLLGDLFVEEMNARKDAMLAAMAGDNVDRFTLDQLNKILVFSRIKYVQDTMLNLADPSLATPDPNGMTRQEANDYLTIGNADYANDFLGNFNFASETAFVSEAVAAAAQRYGALHSAKGN